MNVSDYKDYFNDIPDQDWRNFVKISLYLNDIVHEEDSSKLYNFFSIFREFYNNIEIKMICICD